MDKEMLILMGSLLVQIIGVIMSQNLTKYKIDQLEKKVEKHNNVVERTYKLEGKMREARADIDEIKGKVR